MDESRHPGRRILVATSILAVVLPTVGMIAVVYKAGTGMMEYRYGLPVKGTQVEPGLAELEKALNAQETMLDHFAATISSLQDLPPGSEVGPKIAVLEGEVESLSQRVRLLEESLLENPTTALSVPLLRKDLENLRSQIVQGRQNRAKEIDRVYDLNKWFIALVITTMVSLVGLAIGILSQAKKSGGGP